MIKIAFYVDKDITYGLSWGRSWNEHDDLSLKDVFDDCSSEEECWYAEFESEAKYYECLTELDLCHSLQEFHDCVIKYSAKYDSSYESDDEDEE